MASSPTPPPAAPPEDDGDTSFSAADEAWFTRLSGNATRPPANAAEREADVLRQALDARADRVWAEALDPQEAERQRQIVLQRVTAARAARAATAPPVSQRGPWLRLRDALFGTGGGAQPTRWSVGLAMAGVAMMAVVLVPMLNAPQDIDGEPLSPGMVLRGGAADGRVQRVETATPRRAAEAFAATLRAAGLKPGVYRDADAAVGTVVLVDLDIEPEQLESAGRSFEQHALRRPEVGFTRVVFAKR